MAADNVKTAFRLSSGVNKRFSRTLIWQHQQQQHQKNIGQQQQNIKQLTSGVSKYTQEKICAEVYSRTKLRQKCFLVKLLRTHFLSNASGRQPLEEHKIFQEGFVICFLKSPYGRFMDFLIETYNKGFS